MRALLRPAIPLLLVGLLAGCAAAERDGGEGGDGTTGDPAAVAATVAGTEISRERIEEAVELQSALLAEVPEEELAAATLQLERDVLSNEIQLAAVEAVVDERFGLDVSEEDVEEAFRDRIEQAGGDEAFDEAAEAQGLDAATAREVARDGAYITALIAYVQEELAEEAGVTEDDLRAAYDEDPAAFQSSDARHILVETEEEAQSVLARLEGGESFGDLAMELSIDPGSGAEGGALGVQPRGTYVPEFSEAIYAEDTVPGEVVGPVESQFGFHLIIVDEIITASFEDVRDQLEAQLVGDQFSTFLDEVFAGLEPDVDPYYGVWSPEQRVVVEPAPDAGESSEGTE